MEPKKTLVLLILDGWGYKQPNAFNAISEAQTPQWDTWWDTQPHCLLNGSGRAVGLPQGQMGNSEVGHMHLGAGRVILQDLTRINEAIHTGAFSKNQVLIETINDLKHRGRALHVMGLLSEGGVHSHQDHLFALLALCFEQQFHEVVLHLFLDGRDTPPKSALSSLSALSQVLNRYPVAQIASISGRYFAMDRDNRWDRTAQLWQVLTDPQHSPHRFPDAKTALGTFYSESITDEFIPPTVIGEGHAIESGDSVFFFNFRADRARQLTEVFLNTSFHAFSREKYPHVSHFISMTQYTEGSSAIAVFPPVPLHNTLGEVLSHAGLTQLRLAETEKYAHVTFFLNGGEERVFPGEDRILIASPKTATYDSVPEMSAPALTQALIQAIRDNTYDVIFCNYANADMLGHTGDMQATIKAIECLDHCMQAIGQAITEQDGFLLITADHGNAEIMFDPITGQAHTAHTCEPIPFVFVGKGWQCTHTMASLIDVAPTVLALKGIPKPPEMTGSTLLGKR